jgi:hypothetical protein
VSYVIDRRRPATRSSPAETDYLLVCDDCGRSERTARFDLDESEQRCDACHRQYLKDHEDDV